MLRAPQGMPPAQSPRIGHPIEFPPLPTAPRPPSYAQAVANPRARNPTSPREKGDKTKNPHTPHQAPTPLVVQALIVPHPTKQTSPIPREVAAGETGRRSGPWPGSSSPGRGEPPSTTPAQLPPKHTPLYSNVVVPDDNNTILSASHPDPEQQGPPAVVEQAHKTATVKRGGDVMIDYTTNDSSCLSEPKSESPHHISKTNQPTEPAPATRQEPFRHPNTMRKIHDWVIEISKPIVIVGDSNLARIPTFSDTRVQVDSFPGATFYHLKGVLEKLQPNPTTEKVILSAGLNNCLARQETRTTFKQLQQLIKTAENKFPHANLYVPLINYSDRLEVEKQSLIRNLNKTITEKYNYLPDLNRLRFRTEARDPVHWTAETADTILKLWLDRLNM